VTPDTDRPWLAAYPPGVPADIATPDASMPELFARAVQQFADRPALDFLGAETSYRDLGEAVSRAAGLLHRLGVRAGDRVALVLPNCPQHVVAFHAALRLGAVVADHNPLYTDDEFAVVFADHGAQIAVCWGAIAGRVAALGVDTAARRRPRWGCRSRRPGCAW
jgi:long-chain acyl-CoA synthetase